MCPRDLPRYLETDNPLAKYFQQNFDKHNTPETKLQEKHRIILEYHTFWQVYYRRQLSCRGIYPASKAGS